MSKRQIKDVQLTDQEWQAVFVAALEEFKEATRRDRSLPIPVWSDPERMSNCVRSIASGIMHAKEYVHLLNATTTSSVPSER